MHFSYKLTPNFLTSDLGAHSLTADSMPLVARRQDVGWLWRQLTIDSSPMRILTMFVDSRSQMKNLPSSDPATIKLPELKMCWLESAFYKYVYQTLCSTHLPKKLASLMSVVVLQCPQYRR
jgi:hypothetical protein